MLVQCPTCRRRYDDDHQWSSCPHAAGTANPPSPLYCANFMAGLSCGPCENLHWDETHPKLSRTKRRAS